MTAPALGVGLRRLCSWISVLAAVVLVSVTASCRDEPRPLGPAAERGRRISSENGCAACHGVGGQGGVGPPFVGLAGSEVELIDGTSVVADDAYLVRAIVEPAADLRAGYELQMPSNDLSASEIDDVVAYIEALAEE